MDAKNSRLIGRDSGCTHNIFRLAAALIGVRLALLRNAGQRLAGNGVIIRTGRVHLDGCRFCRLICSFRHCIAMPPTHEKMATPRGADRKGKDRRRAEQKRRATDPNAKVCAQILKRCNWHWHPENWWFAAVPGEGGGAGGAGVGFLRALMQCARRWIWGGQLCCSGRFRQCKSNANSQDCQSARNRSRRIVRMVWMVWVGGSIG